MTVAHGLLELLLTWKWPSSEGHFSLVRPAGRTHLGVEVPHTPGKGKC